MTYGFTAKNDSGVVVIDDEFVALAPARRGVISAANAAGGYSYTNGRLYYRDWAFGGYYQIVYTSPITSVAAPIVALCPRQLAGGCFHSFYHTGGAGNWTGFVVAWHHAMPGDPAAWGAYYGDAQYIRDWEYIAADPDRCPMSTDRYGMRVWNSGGELVFDSGTPVLRVIQVLDQWTAVASARSGMRSFITPWVGQANGKFGFFAASLGAQHIGEQTLAHVSTRIGISGGYMHARVAGLDIVDRARLEKEGSQGKLPIHILDQMVTNGALRTMVFELR